MQHKTQPYKFNELYERIERSRSGNPAIRGKNLRARITGTSLTGNPQITIKHHNTDIAVIEKYSADGTLYVWIDADGYRSATTKHYLNEILAAYNVDTRIFQRDFSWYYTDINGEYDYFDGAVFWGSI